MNHWMKPSHENEFWASFSTALAFENIFVYTFFIRTFIVYFSDGSDAATALTSLPVTVIHKQRLVDKIFTVSVIFLVSIIFINFGCALDVSLLKESFQKPSGIVIGIICQFIFMPLVSI